MLGLNGEQTRRGRRTYLGMAFTALIRNGGGTRYVSGRAHLPMGHTKKHRKAEMTLYIHVPAMVNKAGWGTFHRGIRTAQ